jgi:hypothetical protein
MAKAEEDRLANVTFVDQKERLYFAQAKLGIDVYDFLNGTTGRYLHGCAKQEVEAYRDALEECNPHSLFGRRKIARLQKKAEAARMFMRWCSDAIQEGNSASHELENYR